MKARKPAKKPPKPRAKKPKKRPAKLNGAAAAQLRARHELFCQRVAEGMPLGKAYESVGFSASGARTNASRLMANDRIAARISELIQATVRRRGRTFQTLSVRLQSQRLDMLEDLASRTQKVIDCRAQDENGIETGLIVRRIKSVGSGDYQQIVEEYEYDASVPQELRAIGKQAAEELGEWREKVVVTWNGDLSKLTDEQLAELRRSFRELVAAEKAASNQPAPALPPGEQV